MERTRYTFFIDADLRAALTAIKERDGVPESEQIRRAIRSWVEGRASAASTKAAKRRRTK
jgi:hypothetical protein